jgi:hypothetical protein
MRAKHYVKNQGGLDQCLEVHSNRFFLPEVDETQQWCNAEPRFNQLLGLTSTGSLSRVSFVLALLLWSLF